MQRPLVREVFSYVGPHDQFHILAVHYIFIIILVSIFVHALHLF